MPIPLIRACCLVACLLAALPAAADTPDISPGRGVLGLNAEASEDEFRKALGEPDSVIEMGPDRHGLLYGQNVMLIFSKGRLWEARSWLVRGWSPELFHEWVQYLPKRSTGLSGFTVDRRFQVGQRRGEIEKRIKGSEGDSDEYSIIVPKSHTEVWFGFEYDDDPRAERDVNQQKLTSLVVRFHPPKR